MPTVPKPITLSDPVADFLRKLLAGVQVPVDADDFEEIAGLVVKAKQELGM